MESTLNPSADEVIAKEEAFALWNPTAAALWSLLLSPALGAWLLKRNWERLGHPDKAGGAFGWFFFVIGLNLANLGMILAAPRFEWDFDGLPAWVGLAVSGVWCCLSAYPQIRYVDDHIGEAYPRRSWAAPILIAIMATALFLAVMALLVSATS